jgi:endoglucanase
VTFTVVGAQLRWNGVAVRLRGVAMGDPLDARGWRPTSDYTTVSSAWHANTVRISVQSISWRDQQAGLLTALENDVAAALAADMWVIICWHVIGWPDGFTDTPEWYDTSWELCVDFWTDMRSRYGSEPRVLFELWNEPLSETAYSSTTNEDMWPELKARWEELIDLIRAVSPNVILCGGDMNTYDLRSIADNLIAGDNIGYIWHVYPLYNAGPPFQLNTIAEHQADWALHLDGLAAVAPIVSTEWGYQPDVADHWSGTTESFGTPLVSFLNSNALHWTAWIYHPEWGPPMLTEDWSGVNVFGGFVMSTLAATTQARPSDEPPEDPEDPEEPEEPEPPEQPPALLHRVLRRRTAGGPFQTIRITTPEP